MVTNQSHLSIDIIDVSVQAAEQTCSVWRVPGDSSGESNVLVKNQVPHQLCWEWGHPWLSSQVLRQSPQLKKQQPQGSAGREHLTQTLQSWRLPLLVLPVMHRSPASPFLPGLQRDCAHSVCALSTWDSVWVSAGPGSQSPFLAEARVLRGHDL